MNKDNFKLVVGKWHIFMALGELQINDVIYDSKEQDDDPTYDFVRELWRLKQGK